MEELTDNDIHISPLTIISNRYGGGFLAFNLESWDVPRDINEDGLDFWSFWHHDAKKYIIGKGDTPQEALDNLKAKLNPAPDNPLIDKFLFWTLKTLLFWNLKAQRILEIKLFGRTCSSSLSRPIAKSSSHLYAVLMVPKLFMNSGRGFKCLLSITR